MPDYLPHKSLELAIRIQFQVADRSELLESHCRYCGCVVRINYELAAAVVRGEHEIACRQCAPSAGPSKASVITPRQRDCLKRTHS